MTQDDLKSMTAEELLAEYRVAAISCDNQFQHKRMMNAEQELLRRLQPEGQLPTAIGSHVLYSRGVAHSSSAGPSEPRCPKCGSTDVELWFTGRESSRSSLAPQFFRMLCNKCEHEAPYPDFAQFFPASQQVDVRAIAQRILEFLFGKVNCRVELSEVEAVLRKALEG